MIEEYGLPGGSEKMTDRLYALAYQEGHSYGYNDVEAYYQNLSEMFDDVKSISFK